ncbi:MAG: SDR family NAD(P)-dependent oxidoreductase [Melioribacteraceae bacterium]|nr:MAG: SDR family NAD(P)-dependent oxidoreductase [Melioribacteraceae bacterium]
MQIGEQIILITGGSGEIGRHLAETYSQVCKKIIVLDINDEKFPALQEKGIECYKCDVTDYLQTVSVTDEVFASYPEIGIVINCAGSIFSAPLINLLTKEDKKHKAEDWDRVIKINLSSVFYVTSCSVEKMIAKRTKGLIINVSSVSSHGNAGQSAYSAAKAGVNALTVTWSKELSALGIRTACISPGFIDTESTSKALSEAIITRIKNNIPLKRLGTLSEISDAVKFIIENDYFNGKVLELDGGLVI